MTGARGAVPALMTAGQRQLWLAHQLAPDSAALNVVLAVRVRGELAAAPLARALTALVARHELLRSRFVTGADGLPVREPRTGYAPEPDERRVEDGEDDLFGLARRVGQERLDPAREVFRLVVLRHRHDDTVLVLVAHHLVSDATSQVLLLRDLLDGYAAARDGRPAPPRPRPVPWDAYVRAEQERAGSARGRLARAHWPQVCAGVPAAGLPSARRGAARGPAAGATARRLLPPDTAGRLAAVSASAGVTPFAWLLAAFQAALYRSGGAAHALVGVPATTRWLPGTREAVGYLIDTFPVVSRFDAGTSFRAAARAAHSGLGTGMRYLGCPVELPDEARLFRTIITLIRADRLPVPGLLDGDTEYAGLRLSLLDVPQQEGQTDLAVEIVQSGGGFAVMLRHDTAVSEASTIERLGDTLLRLVEASLDDPGARIAGVPLTDPGELAFLLSLGAGS
ncbi:peptide synthetase [Streptomyces misionensis]|uniref:Peptide synthetase n=1 Tax=Streptomyces misionensis TaxID=67331 RepID=A0A5C6JYE4_9ACTN|nr:condensation domain-containing protein [Streptomyces misionensis]TWV53741.1 peptide synthetase [Streptomyces misionensis]